MPLTVHFLGVALQGGHHPLARQVVQLQSSSRKRGAQRSACLHSGQLACCGSRAPQGSQRVPQYTTEMLQHVPRRQQRGIRSRTPHQPNLPPEPCVFKQSVLYVWFWQCAAREHTCTLASAPAVATTASEAGDTSIARMPPCDGIGWRLGSWAQFLGGWAQLKAQLPACHL